MRSPGEMRVCTAMSFIRWKSARASSDRPAYIQRHMEPCVTLNPGFYTGFVREGGGVEKENPYTHACSRFRG